MAVCDIHNKLFQFDYCPSLSVAILFTVLFGLAIIGHIILAYRFRKPFCWVLIMGAIWEFISSLTRILSIKSPYNSGLSQTSFVFLVLAPLWINAFDYMVLGRMVYFFMAKKTLAGVQGSKIAVYFITSDITSFLIQLVGALFSLKHDPKVTARGLHIYTAGVCLQEAVILVFLVLGIMFQKRLKTVQSPLSRTQATKLIYTLYTSLVLITSRIIFRIIEFSAGAKSSLRQIIKNNEFYLYVFDAAPMFLALLVFFIYHPGKVLKGPDSEFPKLTREEKKEAKLKGEGVMNVEETETGDGEQEADNAAAHIGVNEVVVEKV